MVSRREARELRKALKSERFEQERVRRFADADPEREPRVASSVRAKFEPRLAPHLERLKLSEVVVPQGASGNTSRFGARVSWCETKSDRDGEWGWGESRQWSPDEWEKIIGPGKKNMCALTWAEVDKLTSDTGHKMHHSHEIGDLASEARERWLDRGLEEFGDAVFRFRLGGQRCRAWGYVVQAHFYMVWWEREHNIYPVD